MDGKQLTPRKRQQKPRQKKPGLLGAEWAKCAPCHLRGLSQESLVGDVVAYCSERKVQVTGCYPVCSRACGTWLLSYSSVLTA